MSGYKNCVCCGEIFVSNGKGDDYCESCIKAECNDRLGPEMGILEGYGEYECRKPICGCGEYMEVGVNGEFECFAGCCGEPDSTVNG